MLKVLFTGEKEAHLTLAETLAVIQESLQV